ncbi:unnamed protein product [Agarophyton chilense]|eukprot:gb/GEZJ01002130.1/.p3 GENE.gb/GEZJ01002130.1/~~gb/GEZJ01002130.1/.p3  ORF type:complete len:144 (-),score=39.13 gb/GEZJ01002130.1/:775-1206(-)
MSDGDVAVDAVPEDVGEMDILKALQEVLKKSLVHDGLVRGLNEVAKALDRGQAQLCILASDCDEPRYTRLIEALCAAHEVALVRVPDKKQLGEWAGLCKIDEEGNATKVVGATSCVIKEFGESSPGYEFLLEYLKENKDGADQ